MTSYLVIWETLHIEYKINPRFNVQACASCCKKQTLDHNPVRGNSFYREAPNQTVSHGKRRAEERMNWVWDHTLVSQHLRNSGRIRSLEPAWATYFHTSQEYIVRPCLKKQNEIGMNRKPYASQRKRHGRASQKGASCPAYTCSFFCSCWDWCVTTGKKCEQLQVCGVFL